MGRKNKQLRAVSYGSLFRAPFAAMQWRLLLLWLVLLALPTAVATLPLWSALGGLLDHSVHAVAWAGSFNAMMFGDTLGALGREGAALRGAILAALLLTVVLLPLLNGMVVASGRAGRSLSFGHLLQSASIEYGRMFRLMLWSLLPYAVALGVAAGAFYMAGEHADKATLASRATLGNNVALGVAVVIFVLAHAVMESARGAFVADVGLRSATRALGRGITQLFRRPLSTLLMYILISAIGYLIVLAITYGRVHTPAIGVGGLLLALLLNQLIVLVLGWTHVARVFSMARVAESLLPPRRGSLPPVM